MSDTNTASKAKEEQEEFLRVLKQLNLAQNPRATAGEKPRTQDDHKFWKTQPFPKIDEVPLDHGVIDAEKTVADVRAEPYAMPAGFFWCDVDFKDKVQAQEVHDLLAENYVEDDHATMRLDYSVEFLTWALTPPGFHKQWHVGVRNTKTNKLMAFISGIPVTTRVYDSEMPTAEINFLCIQKKLRSKRLAPVLIKELSRRVNLMNVWHAIATVAGGAEAMLPMPLSKCRYYHRSLNPKKLVEIGFLPLPPRVTVSSVVKALRLPQTTGVPGLRPMEPKDVPEVTALLKAYQAKFKLVIHYNEEKVAHWLLPRAGVLSSFVVENPDSKKITDFASFYHLPSHVLGNDKHKTLRAVRPFFNVATSVPLTILMQDVLVMAKKEDHDVFTALSIMENEELFAPLKFAMGSGDLQYYLYNWRCPRIESKDVAVVIC